MTKGLLHASGNALEMNPYKNGTILMSTSSAISYIFKEFIHKDKSIYAIGVNFSSERKEVEEIAWEVVKL